MSPRRDIKTVGVVGAGTMGAGIALAALYADFEVILQDPFPEARDKARGYIQEFLEKKEQGQKFKKLKITEKLEHLATADVVIEAALEKLELKHKIFEELDKICSPPAVLASNTSTLTVTAIAAATQHPERVAGMHFFNPAPVLPLVEVVRAAQSSEETIETLVALAEALGKEPVVTGDMPGFIVNRVARPFYGEALRLLGEGVASHAQIDTLVEQGAGFRMGPFRLMDLIGIDINAGAMLSMYEQTYGEPRYKPHPIQMQKVAEGALGRKTGRGFYDYGEDSKEEETEASTIGGEGRVVISEGSWAPGLSAALAAAGYQVDAVPDGEDNPIACFVVAGRAEEAARLASWYDQGLAADEPLFIQAADLTLSEAATWVSNPERLVGFDGLLLGGEAVELSAMDAMSPAVKHKAEALFASLGKQVVWVGDSPAMVLPRILCQLINEAAFAVLEGVGDAATIDKAMQLGVNYPRGLIEWGEMLGYDKVLAVLDQLYAEYHEERYRACLLMRKWAR